MEEKFIDIERVISNKNPRLLKILPRFVTRYLKRIIHQDELNSILEDYGDKQGVDFINEALNRFKVTYTVNGIENIRPDGRYLFAANHPLGGLDGMILMHSLGQFFPSVKFPVNDLLMNLPQFDSMFLPINKHGAQSSDYFKILEEAYASDTQIIYFPAGLCSRKQGGKIMDLDWKKSFINKALKHKRDLVPVHVEGRNSNFFYNLANIRAFAGIKFNIEMLYLVDEMFRQARQRITLTIGKPVPYIDIDLKSRNAQWWANWMKSNVYRLDPSHRDPNE